MCPSPFADVGRLAARRSWRPRAAPSITAGRPARGRMGSRAASPGSRLTAIGQPLVACRPMTERLAWVRTCSPLYIPIYMPLNGWPAGTTIGFGYCNNWTYTSGSLTLGPARSASCDRRSKRVADMALPPALGSFSAQDVSTLFVLHEAVHKYPLLCPRARGPLHWTKYTGP